MDVDETQKLDDLQVVDQIKNKNLSSKNGHHEEVDQDKKFFLKFVKSITPTSDEFKYKEIYNLKFGLNKIGRADSSDIIIQSPNLSKSHATIEINKNGYFIWDHNTLNKTKKNGIELTPNAHYDLKQNDLLSFGNLEFTFSYVNAKVEEEMEKETNGNGHVLDIQNTLDDDVLSNANLIKNKQNIKLVIADTDDEDDIDKNYNNVVNDTQLDETQIIPETQDVDNDDITNGHSENETIPVSETIQVTQANTQIVEESKEELVEVDNSNKQIVVKPSEEIIAKPNEEIVVKPNEEIVAKPSEEVVVKPSEAVVEVNSKEEQVVLKPIEAVVEVKQAEEKKENNAEDEAVKENNENGPIVTEVESNNEEIEVPEKSKDKTPKIVEIIATTTTSKDGTVVENIRLEEIKKSESEVIVESTLLDQTTEKIDDEQNQTKIDTTFDSSLLKDEEKPKKRVGRKKKEIEPEPIVEVNENQQEVEEKRVSRSTRRSVAPVEVPVVTAPKRGGRGGRGKKAAEDIETKVELSKEEGKENVEESVKIPEESKKEEVKPEETKKEETKPEESKKEEVKPEETKKEEAKPEETKKEETKPEESKKEEVKPKESAFEESKKEEEGKDGEPSVETTELTVSKRGRGRKSVAKKTEVEPEQKTPPKRTRGKKGEEQKNEESKEKEEIEKKEEQVTVSNEKQPKQVLAESEKIETQPHAESEVKKGKRKSTTLQQKKKIEETKSGDVYDQSENDETPPKKGRKGRPSLKSKELLDENEKVEKIEEKKSINESEEKEPAKKGRRKTKSPTTATGRKSLSKTKSKEVEVEGEEEAEGEEKVTSTPQVNGNKNVFFQHSRSANKQFPTSSSSNTLSNLDITNVSEITAKTETPRKKIKLNNLTSSDDSDTELGSTPLLTKKLKTIDESMSKTKLNVSITKQTPKDEKSASASKTKPSKSIKRRSSTAKNTTSTKRSKKTASQSLIESNISTGDVNNESTVNTVVDKSTNEENEQKVPVKETSVVKKTPKPRKNARQSLNESALSTSLSTRHSNRNTKTGNLVKVITTGILLNEREQQIISFLGGQMVTDPKECTHLITNKIIKSYKFLSCVSRGIPIITERWLDESSRAKMFMNPAAFRLQDPDTEKHYKFSLERAIDKAKTKPLFKAWKIYIDKNELNTVDYTYEELKTMIECAQGEIVDKLSDKEDELIDYCVIFANENTLKNYNGIGASDETILLRMTVDTLSNCLLTQKFPLV